MQTLKVEIQDNLLEKVLWVLNSFNGVKVEQINKRDEFISNIKSSENDISNGNISKINDIDCYIKNLRNDIK